MSLRAAKVVPLTGPTEPAVQNGRIVSISGKKAVVRISGLDHTTQVAFSCLVQPMVGDLILCTQNENGAYYILGIIERPGDQSMTISFPADATLHAEEGALSMVSGKSVTLASGDRLNCLSKQAVHKSGQAVVDYDTVTARGTSLQASFKTVLLISGMINTMAKHVVEKFRSFVRHTEDSDQVNAGQITRKTDGLYSMDSKYTVMVSKKGTKIDGEQIFMG